MPQVYIEFKGICTQLMANHHHLSAPRYQLRTGKKAISHRVFLANSDLIASQIDPERRVPYHVPRMRIPGEYMTDDLKQMFTFDPGNNRYEHVLNAEAIAFANVDLAEGNPCHHESLKTLPSMWTNAETYLPTLRRRVVTGKWTRYASAYIDFTGGLYLEVPEGCDPAKDCTLKATVHFRGAPTIVFRPRNEDHCAKAFTLKDDTSIEISNLPFRDACEDSDYLLHYFATTLDLIEDAPVWLPPDTTEADAYIQNPQAYCSSSTYP